MNKKAFHWETLAKGIIFIVCIILVISIFLRGTSYGKPFDKLMQFVGVTGEKKAESQEDILKKEQTKLDNLCSEAGQFYKKGRLADALQKYDECYSKTKSDEEKSIIGKRIVEILFEKAKFFGKDKDFEGAKETYLEIQKLGWNVDKELARVNEELSKPERKYTDVKYKDCQQIRSFTKRHECSAEHYLKDDSLLIFEKNMPKEEHYSTTQASEYERSMILKKYSEDTNKFAQANLVKQYKILAEDLMKRWYSNSEEQAKNKREAYAVYTATLDKYWDDEEVINKLKEAYKEDYFNYLDTQFSKIRFSLSLESYVIASHYDNPLRWLWKPGEVVDTISTGEQKSHKFIVHLDNLQSEGRTSMTGLGDPESDEDIWCIHIEKIPGDIGNTDIWLLEYQVIDLVGQPLCEKGTFGSRGSVPIANFNKNCEKYIKISMLNAHVTCDVFPFKGDEESMEFTVFGDNTYLKSPSEILDYKRWKVPALTGKVWL